LKGSIRKGHEMSLQLIDWDNPQKKTLSRRTRTVYPVICTNPDCEHVRYLQKSDALRAEANGEEAQCYMCQRRAAGKKGAAVLIKTYGVNFLVKIMQKYRLENPSSWELSIEHQLKEQGLHYEREIIVEMSDNKYAIFDFKIEFFRTLYIEVDGWHHNRPEMIARDALKDAWVQEQGDILVRIADLAQTVEMISVGVEQARRMK